MQVKQPKPPTELGIEGRKLWRQIGADAADQGIELTSQELVWLRQAGKLADIIALMEAALEGAQLIVKGYNGQPVSNPLLSELRMHRQLLAQTVARVDLKVFDEAPVVGPGNRFRDAAMSRWHRSGA